MNVTHKQGNFVTFVVHSFNNYDYRLLFAKQIDKKKAELHLAINLKTNEEYKAAIHGCCKIFNLLILKHFNQPV